jgi:hypothetical protein
MSQIFVCDYETRTKYPLTVDANTTLGQLKQIFANSKKDVNVNVNVNELCAWTKYPMVNNDKIVEEYKDATIFMASEWTEYMQVLLPYYKK